MTSPNSMARMLHPCNGMPSIELDCALALVVGSREIAVPNMPPGSDCVVERAGTGLHAIEVARETQPDVILISDTLPDLSANEVCRALRRDPAIGRQVPILMLTQGQPTPEERVAALHSGVWDFIRLPFAAEDLALKLRVYAQAKRTMNGIGSSEVREADPGLRTAAELARQAQRLGALMQRTHAGMACVVFEVDRATPDLATGSLIARVTRVSDVVGILSPGRIGVLAPGTEHAGAAQLALRVAEEVRRTSEQRGPGRANGVRLLAGFDAVTNARYAPFDPVGLIQRASSATRSGTVEAGHLWLRRHRAGFDPAVERSGSETLTMELQETRSGNR
jgi:CheY-like chemotaxis protein